MVRGNNLKILIPLAIVASVLTIVLYQQQERRSGEQFEPRKLLPDLDIGAIRAVEIRSDGEAITLIGNEEDWSLASLRGFPIDHEQLRELILALGDLEASDRMTDKPENYVRMGVQEDDPSGGRIRLLDENDAVLAEVFVGDERSGRSAAPGGFSPADGQYVRIAGDPWVYKTANLINVPTGTTPWLKTEILEVPATDLQRIQVGDEASTESFTLVRADSGDFELAGEIPEGMRLKDWALDNVGRALANLNLIDVEPADEAEVSFDGTFRAVQNNGLIYNVQTASEDEAYFARIGADYDPALNLGLSDERTSATVEARAMEDPQEAVERLRERHGPWVYQISEFAHGSLTRTKSDLLEPIRDETPVPSAGPPAPQSDAEIEEFLSRMQQSGGSPPPLQP